MSLFKRPEDVQDHSVEPPLSVHEGYPPDAEIRAALAAVSPDLHVRMQQEIDNPTPAQTLSPDQAEEIFAKMRGPIDEEEVATRSLASIIDRIKHPRTRVPARGGNIVSAKERRGR